MPDRSVKVVGSRFSPKGELGQRYLASGVRTSMRLWEEVEPGEVKAPSRRDYETLGCLIKGSAELHLEGQMVLLYPGDCWLVPKGAVHSCKVLQTFTAIEVTRPPMVLTDRAGNQLQPFGAGVKQSKPEWFHAQAGNRLPP